MIVSRKQCYQLHMTAYTFARLDDLEFSCEHVSLSTVVPLCAHNGQCDSLTLTNFILDCLRNISCLMRINIFCTPKIYFTRLFFAVDSSGHNLKLFILFLHFEITYSAQWNSCNEHSCTYSHACLKPSPPIKESRWTHKTHSSLSLGCLNGVTSLGNTITFPHLSLPAAHLIKGKPRHDRWFGGSRSLSPKLEEPRSHSLKPTLHSQQYTYSIMEHTKN